MRILIIGGTGFIGTHLAKRLHGHDVFVASRNPPSKSGIPCDVTKPDSIKSAFNESKPEVVYHLVGYGNPKNDAEHEKEFDRIVVQGTKNILECCKESGVKKVIFSSSASVYGEPKTIPVTEEHDTRPLSAYAATKLLAESAIREICSAAGIGHTILRFGNLYGPGSVNFITTCATLMLAGTPPVIYGDGSQTRDYLYIDDGIEALALALDKGDEEIINVGSNTQVSVMQVIGAINKEIGAQITPQHKPAIPTEITRMQLDSSKAKEALGWEMRVPFNEGLRKTIQHLRT